VLILGYFLVAGAGLGHSLATQDECKAMMVAGGRFVHTLVQHFARTTQREINFLGLLFNAPDLTDALKRTAKG
jgi:N-acetylglucosamine-6-phosphate deacetylase